jgi:AhpD family alkylhydroperoxidase
VGVKSRLNYKAAAPDVYKALLHLSMQATRSGLEESLINLIDLRASQINGCAFCVDMHTKDARAAGETEQRLYLVSAWREASCFTERERAALAWTEAVTQLRDQRVPEDVYQQALSQFSEAELANLTCAVVAINSWNRMNVAFRTPAGNYQPAPRQA